MYQSDFAQVPSRILEDATITDAEQRILSIFELYRFRYNFLGDKTNLNSKIIAEKIGKHPDHVLRIIKEMISHETISELYKIYLKRRTMNEPLKIDVEFLYLQNKITLQHDRQDALNYEEKKACQTLIDKSFYFKPFDANELMKETKASHFSELVKAILDIENKPGVLNSMAYLKASFKKGKYLYSKINFTEAKPAKRTKIIDPYIYAVNENALNYIKENKDKSIRLYITPIQTDIEKLTGIYYATRQLHPINIENFLNAFSIKIEYKVFYSNTAWKEDKIKKLKISLAS